MTHERPGETQAKRAKMRRHWQGRLPVPCTRCAQPVQPWDDWHLDHYPTSYADGGRDVAPAHATCNYDAGAQQTKDRHKIARVPCLHTTTTATGQCETCGAWLTITLPPDDRFPTTVTPGDGT